MSKILPVNYPYFTYRLRRNRSRGLPPRVSRFSNATSILYIVGGTFKTTRANSYQACLATIPSPFCSLRTASASSFCMTSTCLGYRTSANSALPVTCSRTLPTIYPSFTSPLWLSTPRRTRGQAPCYLTLMT